MMLAALLIAVVCPAQEPVTVDFSGYTWLVKDVPSWGPGPNRWTAQNVRVDDEGMRLSIAEIDGEWACAGVECAEALGYGEYRWQIESDVPDFAPRHVLACFLYESDDREIDVMEISRWGRDDQPPVYQHVVQPGTEKSRHRFFCGARRFTVALDWSPGRAKCRMWDGQTGALISHWTYSGEKVPIPSTKLTARMNLWLVGGIAEGQTGAEGLIRSFTFTPMPDAPTDEKRIRIHILADGSGITGEIIGVPDDEIGRYRVKVHALAPDEPLPLYREADHAGDPMDAIFTAPLRVRVELIDTETGKVIAEARHPG